MFSATYGAWLDWAGLIEPGEYFADAAMRDEQLPADITRTYAHQGQLYDTPAYVVRQRTTVDKHATKLIHARLSCLEGWPEITNV